MPYATALRSVDSLRPQSSLASENDMSPSKGVLTFMPFSHSSSHDRSRSSPQTIP